MTWDEYVKNAKHPMVQEATIEGKEAIKVFVKSIKKRLKGRKKSLNDDLAKRFEEDVNFRYIQTAFLFFKYLHQTPEFRDICKENTVIPIAVIWQDQMGMPMWMSNLIAPTRLQQLMKLWAAVTNLYIDMVSGMADLNNFDAEELDKKMKEWKCDPSKEEYTETKTDE